MVVRRSRFSSQTNSLILYLALSLRIVAMFRCSSCCYLLNLDTPPVRHTMSSFRVPCAQLVRHHLPGMPLDSIMSTVTATDIYAYRCAHARNSNPKWERGLGVGDRGCQKVTSDFRRTTVTLARDHSGSRSEMTTISVSFFEGKERMQWRCQVLLAFSGEKATMAVKILNGIQAALDIILWANLGSILSGWKLYFLYFVLWKFVLSKYKVQKVQWATPKHQMKLWLLQFHFDRCFGVHHPKS